MKQAGRIMISCAAVTVMALLAVDAAWGDPPRRVKNHSRYHDVRHGHNHSYLRHGHKVKAVPPGHLKIVVGSHPYFYRRGIWYRPHRGAFVVGPAPVGAVVTWLPRYHTTVWVHGFPYYYANLTYYAWDPGRYGYVVVEEPSSVQEAVTSPSDLFIYPSRGQSEQKQADDRYECHAWAVRQTGYDPSLPLPTGQGGQAEQLRAHYLRAMGACLEGRGYTVK